MRSPAQLCLDVLRPPPGFALAHTTVRVVDAEAIRQRAPRIVTSPETLDFRTLVPEPGGLFDYKVFGPGTVIDAPPLPDDEPVKPRRTQFARITLAEPIAHPLIVAYAPDELAERAGWTRGALDQWLATDDPEARGALAAALATAATGHELMLHELPVLPPDLRPLERLDDDRWKSSSINDLYRRVIQRNQRWAMAIEHHAPAPVIAGERRDLIALLLALFENEDRPAPVLDGQGQPLHSLRALCGGRETLFAAIGELDHRTSEEPLPGRLYRATAVLFALGFELHRGHA